MMWFNNFKLLSKKKLTSDVFEMIFEAQDDFFVKPWQFITFLLPKTWFARAYSILDKHWKNVYFIVKRLENWRWWSKEVCDLDLGWVFKWVWPTGHFVDSSKQNKKLFIRTWTWMVPIYFIIKDLLENWFKKDMKLILWNREEKDLYYIDKFSWLKDKYLNFDFEIFLSLDNSQKYSKWRVTSFLTKENVEKFDEFYICWNPNMVDDTINILHSLWFDDSVIFREKY